MADQFDDLKQFIDSRLSQTEERIKPELRRVRAGQFFGFFFADPKKK